MFSGCLSQYFVLIAEGSLHVWMEHVLSIYSSADGHLGCLTNAAMNMYRFVSGQMFLFLLGAYLYVENM